MTQKFSSRRSLRSSGSVTVAAGLTPAVVAAIVAGGGPARAQETHQTDPPRSLTWVFFNHRYNGAPPNDYPGAWNTPNAWPGQGATVTIKHEIALSNAPYYPTGDFNAPVEPFPGGTVFPGTPPTTGGVLVLSSLNIVPGGWLQPTLEELAFDGVSEWSGGAIGIGTSHSGRVHNQGRLSVTGPFVLTRNGSGGMLNTENMRISSDFGIQGGGFLRNLSGAFPDDSVAEIVLTEHGAQVIPAEGGGGAHPIIRNEGVLRKTGDGTSTFSVGIENHTDGGRNRAGTIAVDAGILLINADSTFHGLKAEIAPGALLLITDQGNFDNGDVTVTGGGVLRLQTGRGGVNMRAVNGAAPTLSAPEGKLECDGAEMRNFTNKGSITVTAASRWWDMTNLGHVRMLADVQASVRLTNGGPADHAAVLDLENGATISQFSSPVENHGLFRKKGAAAASIGGDFNNHSSANPLAGRLEVEEGTLHFPGNTLFDNGARVRVARGATVELDYRHVQDGGTLYVTGMGKVYLNAGRSLSALTPGVPFTIDAAPGTFEVRGGLLHGPLTNAGHLTVSQPSILNRVNGDFSHAITNAGTIHCTAASAGSQLSLNMAALVSLLCTPASVLSLDIAGRPAQRDQWARIAVTGQTFVEYNGTLRVNFGAFTPVDGDRWLVIDNTSGAPNPGDFTRVEFTGVPAGFTPSFEKIPTGIRVGLNAAAAPVSYDTWAAGQNFATPADAAPEADSDGDGVKNLLELALGTDPKSAASAPAILPLREENDGDAYFSARFVRPGGPKRATDLQWTGERLSSAGVWTTEGLVTEYGPLDAENNETVTLRETTPMSANSRTLVRVRVEKLP